MAKRYFAFSAEADVIANVLKTDVFIATPDVLNHKPFDQKEMLKLNAIWDTGATNSVITQRYIDKLGLKPTGATRTYTAGGEKICNLYLVDIGLPNRIVINNLAVTGNNELLSCDMLIGMDVIGKGDFAISN